MGLFAILKTYGKARIGGALVRRAMGGNLLAALAAFWLARKLYRNRARRHAG